MYEFDCGASNVILHSIESSDMCAGEKWGFDFRPNHPTKPLACEW